jgi:DNA invertase Pin-like site-specific DNA recombinase
MKYLRISSEDIDLDGLEKYESNSIVNQRALLDDFIFKVPEFNGVEILEVIDDGRTGTNFQRPGVQKLLDLAERGKIQCIIVKDLSRFGRNYLEAGDYLEQIFPAWGVRFISVNDIYDSAAHNGSTGGIDIAFRNLIAELYSQDLSEKIKSARIALNKSGKTSAPYGFFGYIIDPNVRNKLIIDEPAAMIVRLIYNLCEKGLSTAKIAHKLNEDGVQTPCERKKEQGAKRDYSGRSKVSIWDKSAIKRILGDERYTGKHIYGKVKRTGVGKKNMTAVPQSEWIVVPNAFPAIISDEQFKRVREFMQNNAKSKSVSQKNIKPLFYRKILCASCGKALNRIRLKDGYAYYCDTIKYKDGLECMRGKISENTIIESTLAALKLQAQFADNVKSLKKSNAKSSAVTITRFHGEIQSLQKLIDKSNSTKLALWEKQHAGRMTKEAFQSESENLSNQVKAYTEKIAEFEAQVRVLEMESGQENVFVERFSKQFGITGLSREIIAEFIQAIHIYAPDRIEITLNYADEYEKLQALK